MAQTAYNLGPVDTPGYDSHFQTHTKHINNIADHETRITSLSGIAAGLAPNVQTGTSYTAVLSDAIPAPVPVEMTSSSANTFTVPPRSSVLFPVGAVLMVRRAGTGVTTIAPGAGVTIRKAASVLTLRAQWSGATLIQRAADEWIADGDFG